MVQKDALAGASAELFDCRDRQRDVEELLRGGPFDPEELVESLDALLDLPELYEPIPTVAVVAFRGAHKIARLAATIAGPALVCAEPDGWSILVHAVGWATVVLVLRWPPCACLKKEEFLLNVRARGSAGFLWATVGTPGNRRRDCRGVADFVVLPQLVGRSG